MVDLPWQSIRTPQRDREYLVLLTYLPLKGYRKMLAFQSHVRRIRRQLRETPGIVGYSMRAKLARHRFWTLSVWEDEGALMAFVGKAPHRATMQALQGSMAETAFVRWTAPGSAVPPSWDDAMRHTAGSAN